MGNHGVVGNCGYGRELVIDRPKAKAWGGSKKKKKKKNPKGKTIEINKKLKQFCP